MQHHKYSLTELEKYVALGEGYIRWFVDETFEG